MVLLLFWGYLLGVGFGVWLALRSAVAWLVLRRAQDERGLCLRGGVAECCVLLGPSTGSGRAGFVFARRRCGLVGCDGRCGVLCVGPSHQYDPFALSLAKGLILWCWFGSFDGLRTNGGVFAGRGADWRWCGGRCGVLCSAWSFDGLRTNGVCVCGAVQRIGGGVVGVAECCGLLGPSTGSGRAGFVFARRGS